MPNQARLDASQFPAGSSMLAENIPGYAENRGKTPSPEISMLEVFTSNNQFVKLGAESKAKFKRLDSIAAEYILREVLTNNDADEKLAVQVFQKLSTNRNAGI